MIKKIIVIVIVITIMLFACAYTIYLSSESQKRNNLISNFVFDIALLKALNSGDKQSIYNLISADAQRLFYEIGKNNNMSKYKKICKIISPETIKLMHIKNKKDLKTGKSTNARILYIGTKKVINYCYSTTENK